MFCFLANANAIVSGPTRPINIRREITIFPIGLKSGVIPKDIPTVANAEITSNKITFNGASSVMVKIKEKSETIPIEYTVLYVLNL